MSGNGQIQKSILLTGAGGVASPFLIEFLMSKGYRVLAADIDPYAIGLYVADKGVVIPRGDCPDFLPSILEICKREEIDLIVPLVDEELVSSVELQNSGIHVMLPQKDFIITCLDKYRLMKELEEANIPVPKTKLLHEEIRDMTFPLIVKPRTGRGSRGVHIIENKDELKHYIEDNADILDKIIIQEYVEGPEYTVSVVVWKDGVVEAVVPKEIISKRGVTRMAVTRKNDLIDDVCRKIQEKLVANGPFNVQLRLNSQGVPFVFEINPRFSTSITLTIAAGIDEISGLIARAFGDVSYQFGNWNEGKVLLRRTVDQFIDEDDFKAIKLERNE